MDFFEANAYGGISHAGGKEQYERQREAALRQLLEQDPFVHQLLEYMLTAFMTLRLAFRQMDANQSGSLTKSEFVDSLKVVRSRQGLRQFGMHADRLFSDVCLHAGRQANASQVSAAQLAAALSSGAGFLGRLAGFVVKGDRANADTQVPSEQEVRAGVQRGFLMKDEEKITRENFVDTLVRLRYDDWHFNDLFNRLDQDGSGSLGIGEFTAFLEPSRAALSSGRRRPRPPRAKPRDADTPDTKLQYERPLTGGGTPAQKLGGSAKLSARLSQMGRRKSSVYFPDGQSVSLKAAFDSRPELGVGYSATNWSVGADGSFQIKRPDYLGIVRNGLGGPQRLAASRSELKLVGAFTVRTHRSESEPKHLLPPPLLGMQLFDTETERTRMDVA